MRRAASRRCLRGGRGLRGGVAGRLGGLLEAGGLGAAAARRAPRGGGSDLRLEQWRCVRARSERGRVGEREALGVLLRTGREADAARPPAPGWSGCGSAMPPPRPPAPASPRSGQGAVGAEPLFGGPGSGLRAAGGAAPASRMQRRGLAARSTARVRRQAPGRAEATTAWHPALPDLRALASEVEVPVVCFPIPEFAWGLLGKMFLVNTRCSYIVCTYLRYAHIEKYVPSLRLVAEPRDCACLDFRCIN